MRNLGGKGRGLRGKKQDLGGKGRIYGERC